MSNNDATLGIEALTSRPLADQGRDEYHRMKDAKGLLDERAMVTRPKPPTGAEETLERLRAALYEFGRAGFDKMAPERWFVESGFAGLADAIREGAHDRRKAMREVVTIIESTPGQGGSFFRECFENSRQMRDEHGACRHCDAQAGQEHHVQCPGAGAASPAAGRPVAIERFYGDREWADAKAQILQQCFAQPGAVKGRG